MSFATLMVYCDSGTGHDKRLEIAASLAGRLDARVIGIAARAEFVPFFYAGGYSAGAAEAGGRAAIERHLRDAEERFRAALHGFARKVEWRSAAESPLSFIARECRAADLLIAGNNFDDPSLDPGDLIMLAGRPILMIPNAVKELKAEQILIAWKDTREARRAIFDALPLLRLCKKAVVAEVDELHDPKSSIRRLEDVLGWLECHGVNAAACSVPLITVPAAQLSSLASEEGADLIVSGAYGRGKLREWVFGGVTRELLRQTSRCKLLSH